VPREEWIAVKVPAIIDAETFQAAQERLARNKIQAKRNRKREYLLIGGRLRCGQCGCAMYGATNPHGYSDYRCTRPTFHDVTAPHTKCTTQGNALETTVWHAVERALRNPELITAELERRRYDVETSQTDLDRERQQYRGQLARCDKDLKRWEAAYKCLCKINLVFRSKVSQNVLECLNQAVQTVIRRKRQPVVLDCPPKDLDQVQFWGVFR
jgi:site-specific DNA recombinase